MLMRLYPYFAYATGPAEGLALSDIKVTILRVKKSDKSVTKVIDAQPAQAEIGKGYYAFYYDAQDLQTYDYLPFIEYVGAEPVSPSFYAGDILDVTVAGGMLGPGAIQWTYTLLDQETGQPIADADVWITIDQAGRNVIASGKTDQFGNARFFLDIGDIWVWVQKSGYNFSNPQQVTVS